MKRTMERDQYITIIKTKTGEIIPLELVDGKYEEMPLRPLD